MTLKLRSTFPGPLVIFISTLVCLWTIVGLVSFIELIIYHSSPYYWYPLFLKSVRFTDLTIYTQRFQYFHQSRFFDMAGFPFTYPAPMAIGYYCFFMEGTYALVGYITFCFVVFAAAGVLLGRGMRSRGAGAFETILYLGVSGLLSYPFWFMVDRGNLEILSWAMVALGVSAYWRKKWYLAAIFIGIAASMKLFPFVFLGLHFGARKYKAFVSGILAAVISTLASTWAVGPTYRTAASGISRGLTFFKFQYALQVHKFEIGFDHSLFSGIKEMAFPYSTPRGNFSPNLLNAYLALAAIGGICLFFLKIRHLPQINQVLALTIVSILLPPVSSDYTLTYLYIPWSLLTLASFSFPRSQKVRGLVPSFVCLAFLMAPESYFVISGVRVAGQLKALALVMLLIICLVHPFEDLGAEVSSRPETVDSGYS